MMGWFVLGGLGLFVAWTQWDSHRQTQAILRKYDRILARQEALLRDIRTTPLARPDAEERP
jgi:hypothetical protein